MRSSSCRWMEGNNERKRKRGNDSLRLVNQRSPKAHPFSHIIDYEYNKKKKKVGANKKETVLYWEIKGRRRRRRDFRGRIRPGEEEEEEAKKLGKKVNTGNGNDPYVNAVPLLPLMILNSSYYYYYNSPTAATATGGLVVWVRTHLDCRWVEFKEKKKRKEESKGPVNKVATVCDFTLQLL